jgi:antibiotic biosynthesis monooxygenase (ABM) superfamily enzyme
MQTPMAPHGPVTLIKIFTVEPEKQQTLFNRLNIMTETVVKKCPGFISSILHASFDGAHVTIIAKWESVEASLALRQTPEDPEMKNWIESNGCKVEVLAGVAQDPIFAATPQ